MIFSSSSPSVSSLNSAKPFSTFTRRTSSRTPSWTRSILSTSLIASPSFTCVPRDQGNKVQEQRQPV
jgi:hypothetical protein